MLAAALLLVLSSTPSGPGPHALQKQAFGGRVLPLHAPSPRTSGTVLAKRVYGYLPDWTGLAPADLRWDALTDVIIFDATVDSSSGDLTLPSTWTASAVQAAHDHGGRAHLCATLFSSVDTFLADATARANLVSQLVSAVQTAGGDGANIDFEFVGTAGKSDFVAFIGDLASALHAAIPGSEVTIAMPAYPPWDPGYDIPGLSAAADRLLLMEYDWHWGGDSTAGPVAPLTAGGVWGESDTEGMQSYLSQADPSKLAMGVPYYGYDWPTDSATTLGATTQGTGTAVLMSDGDANAAAHGGMIWDAASQGPWYHYSTGGQAHQTWYDDAQSLGLKYDLVNQLGVAGIMIWALGYEGSDPAAGDLIVAKFGVATSPDAGTPIPDAGSTAPDAGSTTPDAGSPTPDAGATTPDAGSTAHDAGSVEPDAGSPAVDAGSGSGSASGGSSGGTSGGSAVDGGCGSAGGSGIAALAVLLALGRRRR